mgnify:FL=1
MNPNNTSSNNTTDALKDIQNRKAEVKGKLKESTNILRETTQDLFAPPVQATTRFGSVMNIMNQGLAIYDGVTMGMRVVRNLRRVFGRRR